MKKPVILVKKSLVIPDKIPDFDHNAFLYEYTVDGQLIRAIHWSGRYDGQLDHLLDWLEHLITKYQPDYITTTESQQKDVFKAIRDAFGVLWDTQKTGEYVLMFRREVFRSMVSVKAQTTVATKIKNWALWRQMHIGYFNIYHKNLRRRWRILVIHGPAGIEKSPTGPRLGPAWDVAKTGWPRVGASMRRFASSHPTAVQVAAGDANADHRQYYWRSTFEDRLQTNSVWHGRVPKQGTHSSRLIDAAWIWSSR